MMETAPISYSDTVESPSNFLHEEDESADSVVFQKPDVFRRHCFGKFSPFHQRKSSWDILIAVERNVIRAHRVVLVTSIPYFKDILSKSKNSDLQQIKVDNISHYGVQKLIDFAYTGEIEITSANAGIFFRAACAMGVDEVREACFNFLVERLNPENVLDVWRHAKKARCRKLLEVSSRFICNNVNSVAKTERFLFTSFSFFRHLIEKSDLDSSREQITQLVEKWARQNPDERQKDYRRLKRKIRKFLSAPDSSEKIVVSNDPKQTSLPGSAPVAKSYTSFPVMGEVPLRPDPETQQRLNLVQNCCINGLYAVSKLLHLNLHYFDTETGVWSSLKSSPFRIDSSNSALALANCKLFSRDFNYLIVYDPLLGNWFSVGDDTLGYRFQAASAVLSNKLYICGGRDHFKVLKSVECFDLESYRMEKKSMKLPRSSHGVVACGRYLYILGGTNGLIVHDSVERYDPEANVWSSVSPMLSPRCAMGCYVDGEKIYVCGGKSSVDDDECLSSAEVYDPSEDRWKNISPMTTNRCRCSLISKGGKLCAIGGADSRGIILDTVNC